MKKIFFRGSIVLFVAFLCACNAPNAERVLAFPGAEGFGRYAVGGRGGSIYKVTNLSDEGPGSFRDAISDSNRIVVFDVSGIIRVPADRPLIFSKNLTVLGQTAPGDGVQLYGGRVSFTHADNLIVRHLRIRMGIDGPKGKDAAGIAMGKNMIFDHLSVLWGKDENFSVSWGRDGVGPENITIQNSILGQGLQTHSCGGLIQTNGGVTLYRNLYIENNTRNPKVKGLHQFVNNVVYNWGGGGAFIMGGSQALSWAHIENNYFIQGPWNGSEPFIRGNQQFSFYAAGNYYDDNRNGVLDGYLLRDDQYSDSRRVENPTTWDGDSTLPKAHPVIQTILSADEVVAWMLDSVGPVKPVRDEVDAYLVDMLRSNGVLGSIGGIHSEKELPHKGTGYLKPGESPLDTDADGIPDAWELDNGLNPKDASDAVLISKNGYSNIENYANSL